MATATTPVHTGDGRSHVFDRVLVGIDSSAASIEAARRAAVLAEHYGAVTLLGAYPPLTAMGIDLEANIEVEALRAEAVAAVEQARAAIARTVVPVTKVVEGFAWQALIDEASAASSSLIAVGHHGVGRLEGIVAGATMTELVHKAPCSVLIARPGAESFPRRVVVGVDGSHESARACAAARRLAARFAIEVRPLVATGRGADLAAVARLTGERYEELQDDPVRALVAASADADLLVVGSRGLQGLKALGSVSERVAHRARCSTLIVREPT
jgi:nucleotide-binding universal stress UspA family protein